MVSASFIYLTLFTFGNLLFCAYVKVVVNNYHGTGNLPYWVEITRAFFDKMDDATIKPLEMEQINRLIPEDSYEKLQSILDSIRIRSSDGKTQEPSGLAFLQLSPDPSTNLFDTRDDHTYRQSLNKENPTEQERSLNEHRKKQVVLYDPDELKDRLSDEKGAIFGKKEEEEKTETEQANTEEVKSSAKESQTQSDLSFEISPPNLNPSAESESITEDSVTRELNLMRLKYEAQEKVYIEVLKHVQILLNDPVLENIPLESNFNLKNSVDGLLLMNQVQQATTSNGAVRNQTETIFPTSNENAAVDPILVDSEITFTVDKDELIERFRNSGTTNNLKSECARMEAELNKHK